MNPIALLRKCQRWEDFRTQMQSLSPKQKGDCFEALTKYFLQLSPKYMSNLKNIWLLREVPGNIRDHLNLPDTDEGIDLIAETKEGEFWAIQSKYLEDEATSLTRQKLSTFLDLAFITCQHISFCLVCSPVDRFSAKFKRHEGKLGFCLGEDWRGLDAEFFDRLHSALDGKAVPPQPSIPRSYQQEAITEAHTHFLHDKQSRGKLIMPCGTGKSLVGYWIAEKLGAKTILIAVPSLALIRQTLEVWTREMVARKQDVHWIAVCSDESVGDIERDDIAVLTQDLGIWVHTDPVEIAQWLEARRDGTTVVLTTYHSGRHIAQAARRAKTSFDLGIFDEAHKTTGKRDSLFCHLLDDKNITIRKRMFMTATERRYRGQSDQIATMEDPQLYGETFHLLSFKRALEIKPPILSDYKIITIVVTRQEISALIKRNIFVKPDKGKWDKDVEAEMLAAIIALRKAMQKYPIRHAISFHSRIVRAKTFKQHQDIVSTAFPEYHQLETFHVFGQLPTSVRSRAMDDFSAATRSLVTNARCLTEGVDVPNIDCVLFADPKKSTVDIVQAVGRALRPSPEKQFSYVIVPVLLDGEVREGEPQERHVFTPILNVLRALAANDERIIEYFRGVAQGHRQAGRGDPFSTDIPEGLNIDAANFRDSIELKLWSSLAKLSWRPFEEARVFAQGLGLKTESEWQQYRTGRMPEKGQRPYDIPANPNVTYKDQGWSGMGDWLGTGAIVPFRGERRPFAKARAFVHGLELKSSTDWWKYCAGQLPEKDNKPDDIPAAPNYFYKDKGWISWGDWIGTGTIGPFRGEYRPFAEAQAFVRSLGLKSYAEWQKYCKGQLPEKGQRPADIPTNPQRTYKRDGWSSIGDWLGGTRGTKGRTRGQYRPFEEARVFAHSLGLKNAADWSKFSAGQMPEKGQRPHDIPSNPQMPYKDHGWIGWGDWLGTGHRRRAYRPFVAARAFVHSLGLKSDAEWSKFCAGKLPKIGQRPTDIPANPNVTYKDPGGGFSWGDWLGTGAIGPRRREYLPFEEARVFAHSLGLKSSADWSKFCAGKLRTKKGQRPADIPANPHVTYRDQGWSGMGDWLGTGTIGPFRGEYRPFKEARAFVQGLGLSSTNWWKYCAGQLPEKGQRPEDIPSAPHRTYKDQGWINWGDWLGTRTIARSRREFRPFAEARAFVHGLGLKNGDEWKKYRTNQMPEKGQLPDDIPSNPSMTYKDHGWKGMRDWLGKLKN